MDLGTDMDMDEEVRSDKPPTFLTVGNLSPPPHYHHVIGANLPR